jgi:hypothetical protein
MARSRIRASTSKEQVRRNFAAPAMHFWDNVDVDHFSKEAKWYLFASWAIPINFITSASVFSSGALISMGLGHKAFT